MSIVQTETSNLTFLLYGIVNAAIYAAIAFGLWRITNCTRRRWLVALCALGVYVAGAAAVLSLAIGAIA